MAGFTYVVAGRHECPGTPVVVTLWWPRGVSNCKWWQADKPWAKKWRD